MKVLLKKMTDQDFNHKQIEYSLSTDDVTFALAAKGSESVCGYIVIKTEHPKLLIFEATKRENCAPHRKMSVSNLDIFS